MNDDQQSRAAERWRASSPEHLWRALIARQRSFNAVGLGPPAAGNRTMKRPDRLRDLPALMKARLNLVADPEFRPRQYPGFSPDAVKSRAEGEIAWHILSELRTVLAFAEQTNDRRIDHVRGVVTGTAKRAQAFIRRRIGSLGFDDRARCKKLFQRILAGSGTGLSEHPLVDPHFQDRLRLNAMLGIEFPWVIPAEPESVSAQLVRQLREQGWSAERIMSDPQYSQYVDRADLEKLKSEIQAARLGTVPSPPAPPGIVPPSKSTPNPPEPPKPRRSVSEADKDAAGKVAKQFRAVEEYYRSRMDSSSSRGQARSGSAQLTYADAYQILTDPKFNYTGTVLPKRRWVSLCSVAARLGLEGMRPRHQRNTRRT